jgi:hypothetical protein
VVNFVGEDEEETLMMNRELLSFSFNNMEDPPIVLQNDSIYEITQIADVIPRRSNCLLIWRNHWRGGGRSLLLRDHVAIRKN